MDPCVCVQAGTGVVSGVGIGVFTAGVLLRAVAAGVIVVRPASGVARGAALQAARSNSNVVITAACKLREMEWEVMLSMVSLTVPE